MDSCPGTDWNAIAPAPALSQLAGVLAGFVFTGIIVLLSQYRLSPSSIKTLSIFVATFIVLGLDSYDFALLTGESNISAGCSRYWTQSLLASGLLGLGAVLLVSGVVWLVSAYYYSERSGRFDEADDDNSTSPGPDIRRLESLAKSVLYGVTAVVTVGIVSTVTDYLNVTFSGSPPRWLLLASVIYPALILITILALRIYRKHNGPNRDRPHAMTVGTVGGVSYAVTATIVDGIAVTFPYSYWNPVPTWAAIGAFTIALLMPAPTLVLLIYTVPGLDRSRKPRSADLPPARSKPTESTPDAQRPAKFFAGAVLVVLIVMLRRISARR